jgi:hypothetical protein
MQDELLAELVRLRTVAAEIEKLSLYQPVT